MMASLSVMLSCGFRWELVAYPTLRSWIIRNKTIRPRVSKKFECSPDDVRYAKHDRIQESDNEATVVDDPAHGRALFVWMRCDEHQAAGRSVRRYSDNVFQRWRDRIRSAVDEGLDVGHEVMSERCHDRRGWRGERPLNGWRLVGVPRSLPRGFGQGLLLACAGRSTASR